MGGTGEGGVSGASIASAVVITLLLVAAGVTVTVVVAIVLYKKRYRDQMKGMCFKDGERKKLTCSCFREGILVTAIGSRCLPSSSSVIAAQPRSNTARADSPPGTRNSKFPNESRITSRQLSIGRPESVRSIRR